MSILKRCFRDGRAQNSARVSAITVFTFSSAEVAAEARANIKKASEESTWDRLAEFLEKQISAKEVFVINCSFDVDIQTMYEAWTNPKHIMNWMAPTWPETMKTTVTFCEEGPKQTRVTLEWEVLGEATDVERNTFKSAKAGMTQGWNGSFEKLDEYLKR